MARIRLHSYKDSKQKRGEEAEVLTSYTCDTLFCSRTIGRRSRRGRKSHRKKDEGLRDGPETGRQTLDQRLVSQAK